MSKTRRPPPELLRKSHPHLEGDERARAKRELLDALEDFERDTDDTSAERAPDAADDDKAAGAAGDETD